MTVVIDGHVMTMCLTSRSPYHVVYKGLTEGKFDLALSAEISMEYKELAELRYGRTTAMDFMALLKTLPNVDYFVPYYRWNLAGHGANGNCYCDCAMAGGASYLVTEYPFISIQKNNGPNKINVFSTAHFAALLKIDQPMHHAG